MAEAGKEGVLLVSLGTIAELGMRFASGVAGTIIYICEWNSWLAVVMHRPCGGHQLCRVEKQQIAWAVPMPADGMTFGSRASLERPDDKCAPCRQAAAHWHGRSLCHAAMQGAVAADTQRDP